MERHWIVFIATETLVGLTLIIGLIIHERFRRDNCPEEICQNRDCIRAAATILDRIDQDVNPCDNFYEFACGTFLKTAEISEHRSEISSLTRIEDSLHGQLRTSLEDPEQLNDIKSFKVLRNYYKACMNTEAIARRGLRAIKGLLEEIGGWPVLEDPSWDQEDLKWHYYVYKFRRLGLPSDFLIQVDVDHDFRNSSVYKIKLDQPKLSLPRKFLADQAQNEYVQEYRRYMTNVAVYLGANHYRAITELREALNFELKLAEISIPEEDRAMNITDTYEILSIREFEDGFAEIPWFTYISNIVDSQTPISRSETVMVMAPEYFRRLDEELRKTSRRVQINYLVWKAVEALIPYSTESLRLGQLKFLSAISGVVENQPRWKECVQKVYQSLPIALSAKYAQDYIDEDAKVDAEHVAKNIKKEYVEALEKIEWMDKKTKQGALGKANALNEIVAFPEELFDSTKLDLLHEDLEVHPEEYLFSFLNVSKWKENLKFKNLRGLSSRISWTEFGGIAQVYSSYNALTNTIFVPSGALQGSLFNNNLPNYLNYGGIGFVMAHEITSALSGIGRKFGKDGNQEDWWRSKAETSYQERAECFVDQYENYTVADVNETVNGLLTLDNNIADNAGLKYAYAAYLKLTEEIEQEHKLPGLEYSPKQLFWINFAINQCSKQKIEHLKVLIATDARAPSEFRVLGALQNLPQFAEDFECDDESDMYNEEICEMW